MRDESLLLSMAEGRGGDELRSDDYLNAKDLDYDGRAEKDLNDIDITRFLA